MEFIAVAVLGALWAAFLLPSFLEGRREAPLVSTRRFDQRLAKLASLRPAHAKQLARHRARQRRRRVLIGLVIAGLSALVLAVAMQSIALLAVSLVIDALLVVYVLVLLRLRDASEVVISLSERPNSQERIAAGR